MEFVADIKPWTRVSIRFGVGRGHNYLSFTPVLISKVREITHPQTLEEMLLGERSWVKAHQRGFGDDSVTLLGELQCCSPPETPTLCAE